jgi:hypothetical protein
MNIKEALLQEKIYTKAQATAITIYACSSPACFKELMQCFVAKDYRTAQRAAWSVSSVAEKNQELIYPYLKDIVQQVQRKDVHPAVVRNSVRILQSISIPEELHGEVMNACFHFVEKPATPVAIKVFALSTLYNLSRHYPDIQHELKTIIEDRMENETAAFVSRGKKILQQLQKSKAPRV